jgi:hypothetical protein
MTARLSYSASTAMGKTLAQQTTILLECTAEFLRLREAMYQSAYGTPEDWAFLAGEIGCPVDQAQNIFTTVDGVKLALDVPAIKDLAKVDQG